MASTGGGQARKNAKQNLGDVERRVDGRRAADAEDGVRTARRDDCDDDIPGSENSSGTRNGTRPASGKKKNKQNKTDDDDEEGGVGKKEKENNKENANRGNAALNDNYGSIGSPASQAQLMTLWLDFQAASKQGYQKVQSLESKIATLESSMDRFGKFCGEYQLIWRVKNFNQRFQEAKNGQNPIISSPTFDTHRSGYKLQLSLCPNGDGKGYGVAVSLFFAVIKGPYDSLLQWPFCCPVTMTLLEQVTDVSVKQPRDVTMTFTPNPRPDNAPFLGRPVDAKNLSLGFQKFININDLFDGEYIKEDSLFIKVYVDISKVMAL